MPPQLLLGFLQVNRSSAGRSALWLKTLSGDVGSKTQLSGIPFEGNFMSMPVLYDFLNKTGNKMKGFPTMYFFSIQILFSFSLQARTKNKITIKQLIKHEDETYMSVQHRDVMRSMSKGSEARDAISPGTRCYYLVTWTQHQTVGPIADIQTRKKSTKKEIRKSRKRRRPQETTWKQTINGTLDAMKMAPWGATKKYSAKSAPAQ